MESQENVCLGRGRFNSLIWDSRHYSFADPRINARCFQQRLRCCSSALQPQRCAGARTATTPDRAPERTARAPDPSDHRDSSAPPPGAKPHRRRGIRRARTRAPRGRKRKVSQRSTGGTETEARGEGAATGTAPPPRHSPLTRPASAEGSSAGCRRAYEQKRWEGFVLETGVLLRRRRRASPGQQDSSPMSMCQTEPRSSWQIFQTLDIHHRNSAERLWASSSRVT